MEARTPQGQETVRLPFGFISPTIDGLISNFFEWRGAGTISPVPPLGAMWKAEGLFTAMFFGFDQECLYFRLDFDDRFQTRQEDCAVDLHIGSGIQQYKLSFTLSPAGTDRFFLACAEEGGAYHSVGSYSTICRRKILELAVPFKDLGIDIGRELRLTLTVSEHRMEIARYPHHHPVTFHRPGNDFGATMWRV